MQKSAVCLKRASLALGRSKIIEKEHRLGIKDWISRRDCCWSRLCSDFNCMPDAHFHFGVVFVAFQVGLGQLHLHGGRGVEQNHQVSTLL